MKANEYKHFLESLWEFEKQIEYELYEDYDDPMSCFVDELIEEKLDR